MFVNVSQVVDQVYWFHIVLSTVQDSLETADCNDHRSDTPRDPEKSLIFRVSFRFRCGGIWIIIAQLYIGINRLVAQSKRTRENTSRTEQRTTSYERSWGLSPTAVNSLFLGAVPWV